MAGAQNVVPLNSIRVRNAWKEVIRCFRVFVTMGSH